MKKGKKIGIFVLLLSVFLIVGGIYFGVFDIVEAYDTKVFPSSFLEGNDLSDIKMENLDVILKTMSDKLETEKVIFEINGKNYEYTYKDFDIRINEEKLKEEIFNYQESLTFIEKLTKIVNPEKKNFTYELEYDESKIRDILVELKKELDIEKETGELIVEENRNVYYKKAVASYSLNIDENIKLIKEKLFSKETIVLSGEKGQVEYDGLSVIDTKVATHRTWFNQNISRATNLKNALRNIDGVVLQPGEVFAFYDHINKTRDFVGYKGVIGNGICQIASTLYNVELLAGLKTIERHPHGDDLPYVEGGLDATVYYVPNGWLDFKFQNTYEYPIYISAYVEDSHAVIDFWSNSDAKNGITYELKSVNIGYLGYTTYRIAYKDGQKIGEELLATNWYYNKVTSM